MATTPVPLVDAEQKIWEAEWFELTSAFDGQQQGERIRAIFDRNRAFIRAAAGFAKAEFRGASFNGVDAQGGFGWQLLRPQHLLRLTTDAGVTNTDWKRTIAAPGWNYQVGTATVFNQINRQALILLLGIVNHDPSPKSVGLQLQISGITYPPYDLYYAMKLEGGLKMWGFPKPKLIPPLEQMKIQLYDHATGSDEPQILGVTYAESRYLQLQQPALEAP